KKGRGAHLQRRGGDVCELRRAARQPGARRGWPAGTASGRGSSRRGARGAEDQVAVAKVQERRGADQGACAVARIETKRSLVSSLLIALQAFAVREDMNEAGLKRAKKTAVAANPHGKGGFQMEDVTLAEYPLEADKHSAVFGIFDGHAGV